MKSLNGIIAEVCYKHGVAVDDVLSRRRGRLLTLIRAEIAQAARFEGYAWVDISKGIGRRSHSTAYQIFKKHGGKNDTR